MMLMAAASRRVLIWAVQYLSIVSTLGQGAGGLDDGDVAEVHALQLAGPEARVGHEEDEVVKLF